MRRRGHLQVPADRLVIRPAGSGRVEQRGKRHAERTSQHIERINLRVAVTVLDERDVGAGDAGASCEFILRELSLATQLSDPLADAMGKAIIP